MPQKNARPMPGNPEESRKEYIMNAVIAALPPEPVSFVPLTSESEEKVLSEMLARVDEKDVQFARYNFSVAYVESVYDGDTYTIIALHDDSPRKFKARLYGYNTPEVKGSEKEFGIKVRDYVRGKIEKKMVRVIVLTGTYQGRRLISDKYGRLLVKISVNGEDLGQHLASLGYAKAYDGGYKEGFDENA